VEVVEDVVPRDAEADSGGEFPDATFDELDANGFADAGGDTDSGSPDGGTDGGTDNLDAAEDVVVPWVAVPETLVDGPQGCGDCLVLRNDEVDEGIPPTTTTNATFATEFEGEIFHFRPWIRFRMPHPGGLRRVFVYTAGEGAVQVQLSAGYPGGHSPCLDETDGSDRFPVGLPQRMSVSALPGWRQFDFSSYEFSVGGYDEFFLLLHQEGEARVALAEAVPPGPGDYDLFGGLIADAPGDDMQCFSSAMALTDDAEAPLMWMVRPEIQPDTAPQQRWFVRDVEGPALGGHVAFGDFDGDGSDDLLTGGRLYRNDGEGNFLDVTAEAGLVGLQGQSLWGDFDNDGLRDIVSLGGTVVLFRNNGDGTFTDVTQGSGLETNCNLQGVAWLDADNDGFLDLYAACYGTVADPEIPAHDYFFRNNGDGTFQDMTQALGLTPSKPWHGRGVCVADYDADGDPDIYVGNYRLDPNLLWRNQGGLNGFQDVAYKSGTQGFYQWGAYGHAIGPSFGDLNGNGWFDLILPNLAHPRFMDFSDPTTVYLNQQDGTFTALKPPSAGIRYDETHSDSTLLDFDNDGHLDLYLSSVYVGRRGFLYRNLGTAKFTDITWEASILHLNGWGTASSDMDSDGHPDLAAGAIYRNRGAGHSNWLQVSLEGGTLPGDHMGWSNRDAIGAEVRVTIPSRTLLRQLEGGKGVGCQNSSVLHFGLADHPDPVDIHIRWPSGRQTHLQAVPSGQRVLVGERE
jgi:hypothetical protein